MNKDTTPELILVCGCNGAGKSTFTYSTLNEKNNAIYIDPDRIAKEKNCSPMHAGRIALTLTKQFLAARQPFLKESTLSSKSDLKLMKNARDAGFKVTLVYVGLNSADKAVKRVKDRHQKGGHSVPENDIRRRYERSLENLPHAIAIVDAAKIFDNSRNSYIKVATFEKGQLDSLNLSPNWFKKAQEILGIKP